MTRNKKNTTTYLLILLLLGITLGYAYLNTTLNINGTTNITSANWSIYWDNIVFGTNNTTDVTTPATISSGLTEVTFNVNFKQPGDTYEFTVDAVNDGSIDAMISTFSKGVYAANGTTPKTLPDYLEYTVTYSDGIEIAQNQLLESGDTETYKVRVHYKEDITASQLPSTNDNYVFKFSVTYVQATSAATPIDRSSFVYTINQYDDDNPSDHNLVYLNQAIPNSITQYQTASEAMSAFETLIGSSTPFCLKHKVSNNIVKEFYIEFIVTPEMVQSYPDMVEGTYTLRGGINESALSEKPVYEANIEVIKQIFNYTTNPSRCHSSSSAFSCEISGMLSVAAYTNGVQVGNPNGNCAASSSGSYCDDSW